MDWTIFSDDQILINVPSFYIIILNFILTTFAVLCLFFIMHLYDKSYFMLYILYIDWNLFKSKY